MAALVLRLLGEPVEPHVPATPVQRFLVHRLGEVRAGDGPLLATPDLPGSRVSPEALLERLARTRRARHHDVVAALLRLQVDGACVPTPLLEALDSASPTHGLPRAWRVALRRASSPYADDEAPRLHTEVLVHTWDDRGSERRSAYLRCVITTDRSGTQPDDEPTEIVQPRPADPLVDLSPSPQGEWIGAVAAMWPYDAEHVLSLTAVPVLEAPNYAEVAHDVPRVLDALAGHPGHMGTLARHALAAGLSSAKREHRLHAVDAFLDLVPTGRIPSVDMADVMARYAEAWPVTRWAESLTAAAQGPGGSAAVVALLTALLPRLPVETRGLHALLELLRDEHLRLGAGVTDPALTAWLAQHTGSSRKARLARLLSR